MRFDFGGLTIATLEPVLMQENGAPSANVKETPRFLLYGGTGWVGGYLREILDKQNDSYDIATARMEYREAVTAELRRLKPTHVLLAAGVVGKPNVDWCEDHKAETIRGNILGVMNVIDVCSQYAIHVTYYATGCVYHYDETRPEGSGQGFTEEDPPNFSGSFYSMTKGLVEQLVQTYSNVLTLRLRMPIVSEILECPRNFVSKILTYPRVVNIKNSMSVLPELLPLSLQLAKKNKLGFLNFTNPGCISHNEILEMYRAYIDPEYAWENFDLEEQSKVLKAPRSNAYLDTRKLEAECSNLLPIKDSILRFVFEPALARKVHIRDQIRQRRHGQRSA